MGLSDTVAHGVQGSALMTWGVKAHGGDPHRPVSESHMCEALNSTFNNIVSLYLK